MMKKIIAIYPSTGLDKVGGSVGLPLSLLHAFSKVHDAGYEIILLDQRVDVNWMKKLIGEIQKNNILYVAISSMTGAQLNGTLFAAKIIKKNNPKIPVVLGGVHASLLPSETLKNKLIDITVMGEGELTLLELTNKISQNKSLEKIEGIAYKLNNGKIRVNSGRRFMPIDETTDIPYDLVNIDNYFLNLYGSKKSLSLQTGRGCPHRCTYCYNSIFNNRKWRGINAKKIVTKLKILKKFGAMSVDMVDDNFFTNLNRVEKFIILLQKEKLRLKFLTNCRVDYLIRMDLTFLKRLKKVGFNEFFVGIESGSDRVLSNIKKDITVSQILEANRKLGKSGIKAIYSFMAGFPDESLSDVNKTIDLMIQLKKENPNCSLTSLKVYTPFPGTELYTTCIKKGFKPPKTLEGWSKFNYNYSGYSFRSKNRSKLLEKLSYMTYFLDQKTMIKHVGGNPLLNLAIRVYCLIAWIRCKFHFYYFTPEIYFMKIFQKKLFGE